MSLGRTAAPTVPSWDSHPSVRYCDNPGHQQLPEQVGGLGELLVFGGVQSPTQGSQTPGPTQNLSTVLAPGPACQMEQLPLATPSGALLPSAQARPCPVIREEQPSLGRGESPTLSDNSEQWAFSRVSVTWRYRRAAAEKDTQGFNWTLFIQTVLSSVNIKLLPDEEVVVYGVPYLQNLESILDTYSARTIQNYLAWRLVLDRIGSLSQRFKDTRVNYRRGAHPLIVVPPSSPGRSSTQSPGHPIRPGEADEGACGMTGGPQALFGTTVEEVRWRECVGFVNSNMESAVGSLYVREAFPRDSKSMVGTSSMAHQG
ncbi:hypothetical protein P7K49_015201 [Saguinus oedipus]|uniref:Peptidase M13 N-terminal domain-containing protein n=1 Tax=Saguinus oedipus TaxID=9490 RepID=A0ABQ9V8Y3_SAGOE|nr:hypothetical protein P7K49_015201 [Saguinus oedipus]